LDADLELEELLEVTVSRVALEVASVLAEAAALFQQPTVLEMLKERPKLVRRHTPHMGQGLGEHADLECALASYRSLVNLCLASLRLKVASVNHYVAKMEGLEKAVTEASAHKDKAKQPKLLEAATAKLESNLAKKSAEEEKLAHVTKQLVSSFHRTEEQVLGAAADAAAAAHAIKLELAKHVGLSAKEIAAHTLVAGGGQRASVGGRGVRTRRRGKSSAGSGNGSSSSSGGGYTATYDPSGPSRKALLRHGKGADGLPLKLAELRFEQAVTLQAACRRLLAVERYRGQRAAVVRLQALRRGFNGARWYFYATLWVRQQQALARRAAVRRRVAAWHRAAQRVQRAWQGKRVKDKFKHAIEQVLKLQSVGRGHAARQRLRQRHQAAARLQSGLRRKLARTRCKRRQRAGLTLQSSARRWLVRRQQAQQRRAATRLQAWARQRAAAGRYFGARARVATVQSLARRWRARKLVAAWHAAAAALQAAWCGRVAKGQLRAAKQAASRIAARARGAYVRQGAAARAVTVVRQHHSAITATYPHHASCFFFFLFLRFFLNCFFFPHTHFFWFFKAPSSLFV
jgi:hypothetical protein